MCACKKASPTIFHLAWECECLKTERQPALDVLPVSIHEMPVWFQIATIVPDSLSVDRSTLRAIQLSLINVWQARVRQWYGVDTGQRSYNHNCRSSSQ